MLKNDMGDILLMRHRMDARKRTDDHGKDQTYAKQGRNAITRHYDTKKPCHTATGSSINLGAKLTLFVLSRSLF